MNSFRHKMTTKPAVLVLFALITTLLAIPLVVLLAQEKQDTRQYASEKPTGAVKGAMTGTLSGYVYMDTNRNGQRDPEEKPYPAASLRITTKVNTTYPTRDIRSDSNGYFIFKFENQTLGAQIKLLLPDGYKTSTVNPVTTANVQKQIIEFGVTGAALITPKPSCTPRPTCLDSIPRCLAVEPAAGWCPVTTIYPTKPVKLTPTPYVRPTEYRKPAAINVSPVVK